MRTNCIKKTSHNSSNSLIRKEIRRIVWGFERSKIAPQACFGLGGIPNPSRGMPRNDVIRHCGLGRKTGVRNYITTVDRLKALRWPKMALANAFLMQMMRNIWILRRSQEMYHSIYTVDPPEQAVIKGSRNLDSFSVSYGTSRRQELPWRNKKNKNSKLILNFPAKDLLLLNLDKRIETIYNIMF